jgi:hypothetical protein
MEFILNQFVKKSSSRSGGRGPRLGAKRLIKKTVHASTIKKSKRKVGATIARSARYVTKLALGSALGLGKLATLILVGKL